MTSTSQLFFLLLSETLLPSRTLKLQLYFFTRCLGLFSQEAQDSRNHFMLRPLKIFLRKRKEWWWQGKQGRVGPGEHGGHRGGVGPGGVGALVLLPRGRWTWWVGEPPKVGQTWWFFLPVLPHLDVLFLWCCFPLCVHLPAPLRVVCAGETREQGLSGWISPETFPLLGFPSTWGHAGLFSPYYSYLLWVMLDLQVDIFLSFQISLITGWSHVGPCCCCLQSAGQNWGWREGLRLVWLA